MDRSFDSLTAGKKIYFASDFHLGAPDELISKERELKIIRWLDQIQPEAEFLFLVGDLFDFWHEYKQVVPKGFIRFQGKLAELSDSGVRIFVFPGNHDLWMNEYLEKELGVQIIREPLSVKLGSREFHIAHGDGLGPGDRAYKFYKRIFIHPFFRWLFRWIHPDIGVSFADFWSNSSRAKNNLKEDPFREEEEPLIIYSHQLEATKHHDYYIFGHRHLTISYALSESSHYFNLGDWFKDCSYLVFDGDELEIRYFKD